MQGHGLSEAYERLDEKREGMAPMQWPGPAAVLEGLADTGPVFSGQELSSQELSSQELSSQEFSTADLPCRDDPELFFAESPDDVEFAKSLCGSCAARTQPLEKSLNRHRKARAAKSEHHRPSQDADVVADRCGVERARAHSVFTASGMS